MIRDVGSVGFILCALGAFSFVVTYSIVAPWWRTVAGRILWSFSTAVTVILLLAFYQLVIGPIPGLNYVRAFCYTILAAVIWSAEVALIRVQVLQNRATKERATRRSGDPDA